VAQTCPACQAPTPFGSNFCSACRAPLPSDDAAIPTWATNVAGVLPTAVLKPLAFLEQRFQARDFSRAQATFEQRVAKALRLPADAPLRLAGIDGLERFARARIATGLNPGEHIAPLVIDGDAPYVPTGRGVTDAAIGPGIWIGCTSMRLVLVGSRDQRVSWPWDDITRIDVRQPSGLLTHVSAYFRAGAISFRTGRTVANTIASTHAALVRP
jgi:hypothetical protein